MRVTILCSRTDVVSNSAWPSLRVCMCVLYSDNTYDRSDSVWLALMRVTMLCSRTEFKAGEEHHPVLRRFVCYLTFTDVW